MAVESSVQNYFSTTLSSNLGASDLTIPVDSIGNLTSPAYIVIDPSNDSKREVIYADGSWGASSFVTSALGNRGLAGSASGAQAHDSGTTVVSVPLAQHLEDVWDEIVPASTGGTFNGQVVLDDGTLGGAPGLRFAGMAGNDGILYSDPFLVLQGGGATGDSTDRLLFNGDYLGPTAGDGVNLGTSTSGASWGDAY
ncbi:MAG: hypothetical protein R3324_16940, partial [Halobacteriales archaeon]|nr:hypothetical protein [Halobacteriales archaeon]